jgi:hypothetical protein
MYFQYGNFIHGDGLVNVAHRKRAQRNSRGFVGITTEMLEIEGEISEQDNQASIRTAIQQLQAGYAFDGFDAGLFHDDGTRSSHYLPSSTSVSGVQVQSIDFPQDARTGEYATGRKFSIVLTAEYANPSVTFQDFKEEIQIIGDGGPRIVGIETLVGVPQLQQTAKRTLVTMRQTGLAVGLTSRPDPPAPIWPQFEQRDKRRVSKGSPVQRGKAFLDWAISWDYSFLSPGPMTGEPNRR